MSEEPTPENTPEEKAERAVATVEERLAAVETRLARPRKPRPVPPAPPPPPRRGCGATCALYAGLIGLVLAIVIGLMALLATFEISGFLRDPVDNFLAVFGIERDAEPREVDSRTIVLGIREMALLQTTSGDIQIQKTVVDSGPAPDAELTLSYIGTVNAGIDLQRIAEQDIAAAPDGALMVTLPPAQLTGCFLGKPQVLSRRCTDIPLAQDCGAILQRLQDVAYDRALNELVQTATEMDLIGKAYQEAEAQIGALLTTLGHDRVTFATSAVPVEPAPSCVVD